MLAHHIITLTCWNIRPHLIQNWQKSTHLYQKAVETLFMGFAHCVYLWNVYLFIFCIHYLFIYVFLLFPEVQNVFFSGTVPDYLFIYGFILFPEVLCFQALCTLQDRFISVVSFWNRHHIVLNKYKYCEKTLFCLFCFCQFGYCYSLLTCSF